MGHSACFDLLKMRAAIVGTLRINKEVKGSTDGSCIIGYSKDTVLLIYETQKDRKPIVSTQNEN